MLTVMSGLYSDSVLDHFTNPRNVGILEHPDIHVRVGDPTCGDSLELFMSADETVSIVTDISYLVYGCPAAIATSSVATEMIKGKDVAYGLSLTDDDIVEALGALPEGKKHCSLMVLVAFRAAISELTKRAKGEAAK
jgi:nitrogen fixation NifU-like protein